MKRVFIVLLGGIIISAMSACGNKTEEGNPEADSLQNVLNSKMADMDEMNLFLDAVNTSMDSIVSMDGNIVKTTKESPQSVKQQIRNNISAYKEILKRQRERLAILEQKLKNGDAKSQKMLQTIEALKQQLEEKEKTIAELTEELYKKDFNIKELTEHVEKLNTNVAELTETNKAQEQEITEKTDQLNEAYYIIGTKKSLTNAGVLSKGSLFKKSKLSMSNVNTSAFKKIDIRKTKSFSIPGDDPQLLTQAPAGSYTITKNSDGTSTLTITNPTAFWSISNYLVVRY